MKKIMKWMVGMVMTVSPLWAQEGQPSVNEEEQQIEQVIDEAMGNEEPWVEDTWVEQPQETVATGGGDEKPYREVQTLMSGGGGYGAISVGYTEVNGLPAFQMGAQGEWVLGHSLGIGITGVGFTSDFTPVGEDYYALSGGYGGMIIEPIIFGWFPVHISLPVVIGGGGVASYATSGDLWEYDNYEPYFGEYAIFFVAEVGAELEFNLVRSFRLTFFGNYRWTTDLNMQPMYGLEEPSPYPVGPYALQGWSAGMRFKFGNF